jgi:sugar-phosphatase
MGLPIFVKKSSMIKAIIFDMDGLLIDSEPLWREAEIEIFGQRGITLTEEDCRGTTGMRIDEVMKHWADTYPEVNLDCEETEMAVIKKLGTLIDKKGVCMPGVNAVISFFNKRNIPMAVASASSYYLITKVLEKLKLTSAFSVIQSAETMSYGKPHPEIFLETAKILNVKPENCLVFEDSVYGVIAGKAAKMKVVAIPDKENFIKKAYGIADEKLKSMENFTPVIMSQLNSL